MVRKLLVVLLLVLTSPMQAQVLKALCQDITAVVGKSANITCTFSETVSRAERPFLVMKVPLDSKDFPDDVVDCTNGHCKVSEGYSYTERAGSQQVIEIPSAEKSFQGRYQCQYDTHEPQNLKSCTLLVQEANLETGVETQENNVLVTTGDQEKDGQGGDSSVQDNDVIIFIVVPTAAALGIVLVIIRHRRSRSEKKPPTNKPANVDEAEAAMEKEHLVAKGPLENPNFSSNEEKMTRRSAEAAKPNGPVVSEVTMEGDLQQTPKFSNDSHHQSSESSVDGSLSRSEKRPSTNRPASEHEAEAANGPEQKENLLESGNPPGNANLSSREEKRSSSSADAAAANVPVLSDETMDGDLQQTPEFSNDSHHQSSESSVDGNEDATPNVATRPAETSRTIEC